MLLSLHGELSCRKLAAFKALLTSLAGCSPVEFALHEINWRPAALSLQSPVFDKAGAPVPWEKRSWTLVQKNQPEPPKVGVKLANRQIVHSVALEGDPLSYLADLGFAYAFEFICRGFEFVMPNGIVVTCFRVYRQYQINTASPIASDDSWVVRVAVLHSTADQVSHHSSALFALSAQLAGIVSIGVVDHTLLQQKFKYKD
ncbi:hypothetical protein HDU91_003420 [Kappamyces sp. JEL0680]|nr:hypothetical protein HDU91_003420 [Kappamyces sp. JEL0680]